MTSAADHITADLHAELSSWETDDALGFREELALDGHATTTDGQPIVFTADGTTLTAAEAIAIIDERLAERATDDEA